MPLRELARESHISVAQLSKIETGMTPVTLRHFDAIRKALGVPLATLLPAEAPSSYVIARHGAIAQEPMRGGAATVANLAESFIGKRIEPFLYRSFSVKRDGFVVHDSEYFVFVLNGALEVAQADNGAVATERLERGDALYWHCDVPNRVQAWGTDPGDIAEQYAVRYLTHGKDNTSHDELGTLKLPGFSVSAERDVVVESGRKIAFLRQMHGITAAQLAGRVAIGVRQLAAIESGRRAADIDLLFKLAAMFRRPVRYFLGADGREGPARTILRADAIDRVSPRRRGKDVFVPLAGGMPDRAMHPYRVSLVSDRATALVRHEGETCVYVLHGEVEFRTIQDGREISDVLGAGDSLFLDCRVPYDLRAHSKSPWDSPSQMIQVFWSPHGNEPPIFD